MNLYSIDYTNNDATGNALVQSESASKAVITLREKGRLNEGLYKATSINQVGCNDSTVEDVLKENWRTPSIVTKQLTALEREKIKKEILTELRPHINPNILYVDKIGIQLRNPHRDGYLVLYKNYNKEGVYVSSPNFHLLRYNLDGSYVDLGVPTKYSVIESPVKRLKIYDWGLSHLDNKDLWRGPRFDIERFDEPLALFYITRPSSRNNSIEDVQNLASGTEYPHYKFAHYISKDTNLRELKRIAINFIEDKYSSSKSTKSAFERASICRKIYHPANSPYTVIKYIAKFAIGRYKYARRNPFNEGANIKGHNIMRGFPLYIFEVYKLVYHK